MAAWGREEQTSRAVEAEETMPEGGSPASRSQMTMAGPEAPGDQSSVSISAQVDQVQRRSIRAREAASSEVLIWIRKRMGSSSFVRSLTAGMPAAEIHRPGVCRMTQYIVHNILFLLSGFSRDVRRMVVFSARKTKKGPSKLSDGPEGLNKFQFLTKAAYFPKGRARVYWHCSNMA